MKRYFKTNFLYKLVSITQKPNNKTILFLIKLCVLIYAFIKKVMKTENSFAVTLYPLWMKRTTITNLRLSASDCCL